MKILTTVLILALSVALSVSAQAKEDDQIQALIAGMTAAYGGDAVVNLKSYQLEDRILSTTLGQGRTPDLVEVTSLNQILKVDIAGKQT